MTDEVVSLVQVTPERVAEFERVVASVKAWADGEEGVAAVGLAGSWARGAARMDSDADVVVLCADPERFDAGRRSGHSARTYQADERSSVATTITRVGTTPSARPSGRPPTGPGQRSPTADPSVDPTNVLPIDNTLSLFLLQEGRAGSLSLLHSQVFPQVVSFLCGLQTQAALPRSAQLWRRASGRDLRRRHARAGGAARTPSGG